MKRYLTAIFTSAALCAAAQDSGVLTYIMASPDATVWAWGTQKRETYDVAILMNDPQFIGQEIVGMSVPYLRDATVSEYTAWMSKELTISNVDGKNVNVPDITSAVCTADYAAGWITARFDEPYCVPEEGVYVGYSFTVDALTNDYDKQPVAVVKEVNPGGFYLHTSRTYLKWEDRSETLGQTSPMRIYIKGDFAGDYATVMGIDDVACLVGGAPTAAVTLQNMGTAGIYSVGYTYTCDGQHTSLTYELPEPAIVYGQTVTVNLPIPGADVRSSRPFTITVGTVNGRPNRAEQQTATAIYHAYDWTPKYTPMYEEFTGLWCGWCPSGFVGMREMHRLYGDDFVCVSYHYDDLMWMKGGYPAYNEGEFPSGAFDRTYQAGPYGGFSDLWEWLLPEAYEQVKKLGAPVASVEGSCQWDGDDAITAHATARFIYSPGKTYRLAYVLEQHDMSNPFYVQRNYFCRNDAYKSLPLLEEFANGNEYVTGLHYDDVAILASPWLGVEGSLPVDIEANTDYESAYTFSLTDAINTKGTSLVQNKSQLAIVAYLVEDNGTKYGKVVNCCYIPVPEPDQASITSPTDDAETLSTRYTDMLGRPATPDTQGITLRIDTQADGTVRITKQLKK